MGDEDLIVDAKTLAIQAMESLRAVKELCDPEIARGDLHKAKLAENSVHMLLLIRAACHININLEKIAFELRWIASKGVSDGQ
jgi:hypothetical protein